MSSCASRAAFSSRAGAPPDEGSRLLGKLVPLSSCLSSFLSPFFVLLTSDGYIIGCILLTRGGGFASKLARFPGRVNQRAKIIDPRRRFRITARAYHGSRAFKAETYWSEDGVSNRSSRASQFARTKGRILWTRRGGYVSQLERTTVRMYHTSKITDPSRRFCNIALVHRSSRLS